MASNASQQAPSFVFGYLPKETISATAVTNSSVSLYDRTSAFLSAFTEAVTPSPKLTIEQQRSATLQHVKVRLEGYIDAKRTAGIAITTDEQMDVSRVEKAIRELSTDA